MKIAFSTVTTPEWDFATTALRAKEYGYDGVEIVGQLHRTLETSSALFTTRPAEIIQTFGEQGIAIAALVSSISITGNAERDALKADQLITFIDKAAGLKTSIVKLADIRIPRGKNRLTAAASLADWLLPLGDYAATRGVTLVVENQYSLRTAREMWLMLDRLSHPSVGCCWNVFNAAEVGETPAVSVPTLNSRIVHTHVKDAKLGTGGATYAPFGEGDIRLAVFLERLRGVGYDGWVSVELAPGTLAGLPGPDVTLGQAVSQLRAWTTAKLPVVAKAVKKAAVVAGK